MKIVNKIKNIIIVFCCFSLIAVSNIDIHAQKKQTTTTKKAPAKKQTTTTKKAPAKKQTTKKKTPTKNTPPNSHIFLQDTLLSSGISYKQLITTINGVKHKVNIIQVDLNNSKAEVSVIKGGNNVVELETLTNLLSNSKVDTSQKEIVAGVNANFWKGGTNYPMGPTVIDGEIAEMRAYKKWTSTFFNEDGEPFMGFFNIQGEMITKNGSYRIPISDVNHRKDSNGVICYNRFSGDTIPYINSKKVKELMIGSMDNLFVSGEIVDSTESVEASVLQNESILEAERASKSEYFLDKIVLRYIDTPAVNTFIRCKVENITSGSVGMPDFGCIISIGKDTEKENLPDIGEIVNLHFWTNQHESEVFINAVCGPPRLVRDGIARPETSEEDIYRKKFINPALPRTAIGYNKNKTKLFLVAVPGSNKQDGTIGASLFQLADIMEYIGCYNAHNLDGGGSTNMVIGEQNVINPAASRKLSVGIAAIKLKIEKQTKLQRRKKPGT
ncbi:MAG: phosphodiester glycosidase family protein [Bacteroidetes bacterium]|nr:phosphodiester glycosidase family protein [Bacteroidota bacterium]